MSAFGEGRSTHNREGQFDHDGALKAVREYWDIGLPIQIDPQTTEFRRAISVTVRKISS